MYDKYRLRFYDCGIINAKCASPLFLLDKSCKNLGGADCRLIAFLLSFRASKAFKKSTRVTVWTICVTVLSDAS